MEYNLEKRTLEFGKRIVKLSQILAKNIVNIELIKQLVKAGSSIGANYREANGAESKKDFAHKIRISLKEAKETHYWLELVIEANAEFQKRIEPLLRGSLELIKIFSSISKKSE
jgi:four helix bundle protein